jgi:putative transposase
MESGLYPGFTEADGATDDNQFLGKRAWRNTEARIFRRKRALQQCGSKNARRRLRKLRGRQRRFRRDCDHVLSKQIVQGVEPGSTIVVENLTNIRARVATRRGRQARRLHGWSFAQLRSFIAYKAEERGCTVVGVDPRHTSQRCSRCGYTARNNRRSRGFFRCRSCGFSLHADLNGARNIAATYHVRDSSAVSGGQLVNLPIAGVGEFVHPATCKPPTSVGGC